MGIKETGDYMTHVPLRMCIVCRRHLPLSELIRMVADKESRMIVPDIHKKKIGRGAYICRNIDCIKKAEKRQIPQRHLKYPVSEELYKLAEDMV